MIEIAAACPWRRYRIFIPFLNCLLVASSKIPHSGRPAVKHDRRGKSAQIALLGYRQNSRIPVMNMRTKPTNAIGMICLCTCDTGWCFIPIISRRSNH